MAFQCASLWGQEKRRKSEKDVTLMNFVSDLARECMCGHVCVFMCIKAQGDGGSGLRGWQECGRLTPWGV